MVAQQPTKSFPHLPSGPGIEPIGGVRPEIDAAVGAALDHCLTQTDLGMGQKYTVGWLRGGLTA